jgi:hypothetical protein
MRYARPRNRYLRTTLVSTAYQWADFHSTLSPRSAPVAEVENLRAAADTLHLTHSAVSQQIRGLEEQLGFDLFERRGRRVVLNAAGHALLRSVQSALAQLDDGVQAAAAAASGTAQRLRVTGFRRSRSGGCFPASAGGVSAIPISRSRSMRRSTPSTSCAKAFTRQCAKARVRGRVLRPRGFSDSRL